MSDSCSTSFLQFSSTVKSSKLRHNQDCETLKKLSLFWRSRHRRAQANRAQTKGLEIYIFAPFQHFFVIKCRQLESCLNWKQHEPFIKLNASQLEAPQALRALESSRLAFFFGPRWRGKTLTDWNEINVIAGEGSPVCENGVLMKGFSGEIALNNELAYNLVGDASVARGQWMEVAYGLGIMTLA